MGVICVPFFAYETGILWAGDTAEAWQTLGVNLLGAAAIIAWSALWSVVIFFPLSFFDMLRIDRETEFRGNDLIKHGEAAYPADAWVELQDNKDGADANNGPSVMSGTSSNANNTQAGYNDAFAMVPSGGKLMAGLKNSFGNVAANSDDPKGASNAGYNNA